MLRSKLDLRMERTEKMAERSGIEGMQATRPNIRISFMKYRVFLK